MRKIVVGLLAITTLFLTSCGGVSQAEYDKVVAERDALQALLDGDGSDTSLPLLSDNTTIHVGKKASTSDFEITFIDCVMLDKIEVGNLSEEAESGFTFAIFTLELKNISSDELYTPFPVDMSFYADDTICDYVGLSLSINGYEFLDTVKINPGRTQKGYIPLEVPKGTKTVEIEYDGIILEHTFTNSDATNVTDTTPIEYKINVGESFTSNRFNATLLDYYYISYWSMGLTSYPAKDGYVYIVLALSFENTTQNDETINPFSDFTYYADNQLCSSSTMGKLDIGAYSIINDNEVIKPGRIAKGYVAAEIPENSEILEVEFDGVIFALNLSETE